MRLLLASASPARRATLRSAGIEPLVSVSGVDEDALLAAARRDAGAPVPAAEQVLLLARAKACDVAARTLRPGDDGVSGRGTELGGPAAPGGATSGSAANDSRPGHDADDVVVLGCDSMLELDGAVLGKPRDAADAVGRWRAMRGRSGSLHTGHWLVRPAGGVRGGASSQRVELGATSTTVVHFADVSDAEIAAYVATGEPLAVAGAFTVDGLGGPFVTRIEGDYHGVVGLSLPLLRDLLAAVSVPITSLWDTSARAD